MKGEILKGLNLDTYGCYLSTAYNITERCELISSAARPSLLFLAQGAWWDGRSLLFLAQGAWWDGRS